MKRPDEPGQAGIPAGAQELGVAFDGVDAPRRYFSLHDIETHVLLHRAQILRRRYRRIAAISRGGLYAGALLSHTTGIELASIQVDRGSATVAGCDEAAPQAGAALLLVDDIAGKGYTLVIAQRHFERLGWQVDVFVTASDELSRIEPTYGIRLSGGVRPVFPWERWIMGQEFDDQRSAKDEDRWLTGFDLDGVFLDDVPGPLYEENLALALAMREGFAPYAQRPPQWMNDGSEVIISGRMDTETPQTRAWLAAHGLAYRSLHLRERLDLPPPVHKAGWIARLGVTEFVESELWQAEEIARLAPFCVVWHYDGRTGSLARIDGQVPARR
ncbi:MAG: hypothetical protein KGM91_09915 [Burkholderiales bacterium]|nr:hypothetical protein [Burkholderiales bacterium]